MQIWWNFGKIHFYLGGFFFFLANTLVIRANTVVFGAKTVVFGGKYNGNWVKYCVMRSKNSGILGKYCSIWGNTVVFVANWWQIQ